MQRALLLSLTLLLQAACGPTLNVGPQPELDVQGSAWLPGYDARFLPEPSPRFALLLPEPGAPWQLAARHRHSWSRAPLVHEDWGRAHPDTTPDGVAFGPRLDLFAVLSSGSSGILSHLWRPTPDAPWSVQPIAPGGTFDVAIDRERARLHLAYADVWKITYHATLDLGEGTWSAFSPIWADSIKPERIFIELDAGGAPVVFGLVDGALHSAHAAYGRWEPRRHRTAGAVLDAAASQADSGRPQIATLDAAHHVTLHSAQATLVTTLEPERWSAPTALFLDRDTLAVTSPGQVMLCESIREIWSCGETLAVAGEARQLLHLQRTPHLLLHRDGGLHLQPLPTP